MAEDGGDDDRKERKPRPRPSMQIYRPPGTRASQEDAKDTPPPIAAAGPKPPHNKRSNQHNSNNKQTSPAHNSPHSATPDAAPKKLNKGRHAENKPTDQKRQAPKNARTYQRSKTGHKFDVPGKNKADKENDGRRSASPTMEQRLSRTDDAKTTKPAPPVARVHAIPMTPRPMPLSALMSMHKPITPATPIGTRTGQNQRKGGKVVTEADWVDICQIMLQLDMKDRQPLDTYIASRCLDEATAAGAARSLVEHVVEGAFPPLASFPKNIARSSAHLIDVGTDKTANAFHAALVERLRQYALTANSLRQDHPRWWYTLLNYLSDMLACLGSSYDGELVNVVLYAYAYMLKAPMLHHLNIKELELLIASLLHIGQDLERQCPEQVAALRDCIRDAFVAVSEPWQRKMVLLLVELAACGWKLPEQANDYYFAADDGKHATAAD